MTHHTLAASVLSLSAALSFAANPMQATKSQEVRSKMLSLPLSFEANRGQTSAAVKYLAHGQGYSLLLTNDSAVFHLADRKGADTAVRMRLANANTNAKISTRDPLAGKINYFIGNDPSKWVTGAPTYSKVDYEHVYPGVDLVYYGTQTKLEYDFVVSPGADPNGIAVEFSGAKPKLTKAGDLELEIDGAPLTFRKPVAYQTIAGHKQFVDAAYRLSGNRVEFALGRYDRGKSLVIDPVLDYLTYLGGTVGDSYVGNPTCCVLGDVDTTVGQAVAVDPNGNLYVTGTTHSLVFPLQNPYEPQNGGTTWCTNSSGSCNPTAFVTELNASGSALVYSTYLGGLNGDNATAIAVDSTGAAYVTGYTASTNFPVTTGALISTHPPNGLQAGFVTKLAPGGGSLVYSSYLGSAGTSAGFAIAVDSQGNAYVGGVNSQEPGSNAGNPCYGSPGCFPTTSNALIPGSLWDRILHPNFQVDQGSGFVVVLGPSGGLLYSSLFTDTNPSTSNSQANPTYVTGVAVDPSGNFYLTGGTLDPRIPITSGAYQTSLPTDGTNQIRGWVAKFSPVTGAGTGASLVYSTFLGGSGNAAAASTDSEFISGIAVDASGNAYVSGGTNAPDYPVTPGANQTNQCGTNYACQNFGFLTKLNPSGSALVWSTLVGAGGTASEIGPPRVDAQGYVYITGLTAPGQNYPIVNPPQPVVNIAANSIFVTKYDPTGSTILFSTVIQNGSNEKPGALDVDAQGNIYVGGSAGAGLPTTTGAFQTTNANGTYAAFLAKINPFETATIQLTVAPSTANTGTQVTMTATLTGVSGNPTPTGSVNFYNNGTTLLGTGPVTAGVATFSSTTLAAGTYSVTAVYSGDGTYSPVTSSAHPLTINALPAAPTISPNPAAFGNQTVNVSASISVTVTNTAATSLAISSVTPSSSGDFSQTNNCVTTLTTNQFCTITVTFKPSSVAVESAVFTITDNAGTQTLNATGTGVAAAGTPKVTLSKTSLTFPAQYTGSTSTAQTFTITNSGTAALTLTNITASGDFAQTNNCPSSLAVTLFCTVSVTFSPTATGPRNGALTITDNASPTTQSVTLTGTGIVGLPRVTVTVADSGTQSAGVMYVDLNFLNNGNGIADNIKLTVLLPVSLGGGLVGLDPLTPSLPITVGNLAVGASKTIRIYVDVPAAVSRFSLIEVGTVQDAASDGLFWASAQLVSK